LIDLGHTVLKNPRINHKPIEYHWVVYFDWVDENHNVSLTYPPLPVFSLMLNAKERVVEYTRFSTQEI